MPHLSAAERVVSMETTGISSGSPNDAHALDIFAIPVLKSESSNSATFNIHRGSTSPADNNSTAVPDVANPSMTGPANDEDPDDSYHNDHYGGLHNDDYADPFSQHPAPFYATAAIVFFDDLDLGPRIHENYKTAAPDFAETHVGNGIFGDDVFGDDAIGCDACGDFKDFCNPDEANDDQAVATQATFGNDAFGNHVFDDDINAYYNPEETNDAQPVTTQANFGSDSFGNHAFDDTHAYYEPNDADDAQFFAPRANPGHYAFDVDGFDDMNDYYEPNHADNAQPVAIQVNLVDGTPDDMGIGDRLFVDNSVGSHAFPNRNRFFRPISAADEDFRAVQANELDPRFYIRGYRGADRSPESQYQFQARLASMRMRRQAIERCREAFLARLAASTRLSEAKTMLNLKRKRIAALASDKDENDYRPVKRLRTQKKATGPRKGTRALAVGEK